MSAQRRLAIVVAAAAFACSGEEGPSGSAGSAPCADTDLVLQGEAEASRTLRSNCTYRLAGNYHLVGDAAELSIEPGVTIEVEGSYALRASMGARVVARGTAEHPITMRAADAVRAVGWQGLQLGGSSTSVRHELHHVVVRDGGSTDDPNDDTHPAVIVAPEGSAAELLFDHLTIEDPKHAGLAFYRDGAAIAVGSTDLVVRGAGGYPLVLEAQNLARLPARQALDSTNPARERVLAFGGNEGLLRGDHVWAPQDVPIELAGPIDVGGAGSPGSLTVTPPARLLLREGVDVRATWGVLTLRSTPTEAISIDQAEEGKPWGSIVLTSTHETSLGHQSVIEGVSLRHGGHDDPMVFVLGPGGPGSPEDCTTGPTVQGNTFADPDPNGAPFCFTAADHSFPYEKSNTFVGCGLSVKCD